MSRQEGWMRRAEVIVILAAALVVALAYVISRLFPR
jgi:hypothetical protein